MAKASQAVQLLRLLARLHPELWEIIHPHLPLIDGGARSRPAERFAEVALNPQPLPPRVELRVAVQRTARAVADATIAAHLAGRDAGEVLQQVGDDWCPNPPGPKIPWPRHWPHPWPSGEPYPIEPEFVIPALQAEAGLVFQSYALDIADERLSVAFGHLADRLIDAALMEHGERSRAAPPPRR